MNQDARSTEHKVDRNLHTKRLQNTNSHINIILRSTALYLLSCSPEVLQSRRTTNLFQLRFKFYILTLLRWGWCFQNLTASFVIKWI